jgi:hypothetical protein
MLYFARQALIMWLGQYPLFDTTGSTQFVPPCSCMTMTNTSLLAVGVTHTHQDQIIKRPVQHLVGNGYIEYYWTFVKYIKYRNAPIHRKIPQSVLFTFFKITTTTWWRNASSIVAVVACVRRTHALRLHPRIIMLLMGTSVCPYHLVVVVVVV